MEPNTTPHCFEIKGPKETIYYVGEKSTAEKSSLLLDGASELAEKCSWTLHEALQQAVGEKQAKPWEEAIRSAFMPVTPKPSVKTVVSVTESCTTGQRRSDCEKELRCFLRKTENVHVPCGCSFAECHFSFVVVVLICIRFSGD